MPVACLNHSIADARASHYPECCIKRCSRAFATAISSATVAAFNEECTAQQKWTHDGKTDGSKSSSGRYGTADARWIDGETAGDAEQEGIPSGEDFAASSVPTIPPAPARFIDDDLLSQALAELLRKHARHDVSAAARWLRHDQAHRPGGIIGTGPSAAKQYTAAHTVA